MGSPSDEIGREADEGPQRRVTLTRALRMKATEVTQTEWRSLMGNNPSSFSSCGDDCPVEGVSWWEAAAYTNALSASSGLPACHVLEGCTGTPGSGSYSCSQATFAGPGCSGYRLPTEAEWEYAARAGTSGGTYAGTSAVTQCEQPNAILDPIAWYCGNAGLAPHPVAAKTPNAFGLHDMLGNVWEWCADWHGSYPSGAQTDPVGAASGSRRASRGGSWVNPARSVRAADRNGRAPDERSGALGLRPVRTGL